MSTLGTMNININVNDNNAKQKINDVKNSFDTASKDINKNIQQVSVGFGDIFKSTVIVSAVQAIGSYGKGILALSGQVDKAKISFTSLLGSSTKAKESIAELQKFGAETPFEFPGLLETSKKLIAFGVAQADLIPTMKMLGEASQGQQDKLNQLANAYGKLASKGRASMEELNMFTDAGVPIIAELAKQYGVSTEKVFKLVETGKVGFNEVNEVLKKMTSEGGQFFGNLDKQAQTLDGVMSTFKDSINGVALSLLDSLKPAMIAVTKSATAVTDSYNSMEDSSKELVGDTVALGGTVLTLGYAWTKLKPVVAELVNLFKLIGQWASKLRFLLNPVTAAIAAMATPIILIMDKMTEASELYARVSDKFSTDNYRTKTDVQNDIRQIKKDIADYENTIIQMTNSQNLPNQSAENIQYFQEQIAIAEAKVDQLKTNWQSLNDLLLNWDKRSTGLNTSPTTGGTTGKTGGDNSAWLKLQQEREAFLKSYTEKYDQSIQTQAYLLDKEYNQAISEANRLGVGRELVEQYYAQRRIELEKQTAGVIGLSMQDWAKIAEQSLVNLGQSFAGLMEQVYASGKLTVQSFKSFVKEILLQTITLVETTAIAMQAKLLVEGIGWSITTFGASLGAAAGGVAKILAITAGLEGLKTGIRALKDGGVLTGPQYVLAGEAGTEAFMPLQNATAMRYIGKAVADAMPQNQSQDNSTRVIQLTLDGRVVSEVVDNHRDEKAGLLGGNNYSMGSAY